MSRLSTALLGGAAGAVVLTAVHQAARLVTDDAPRMDILGMQALEQAFELADATSPSGDSLYYATLAGDIASNASYYALAALGPEGGEVRRGAALGLLAGIGGVILPPYLGLDPSPARRTPATAAMTVVMYTLGGLAAGAAMRRLAR